MHARSRRAWLVAVRAPLRARARSRRRHRPYAVGGLRRPRPSARAARTSCASTGGSLVAAGADPLRVAARGRGRDAARTATARSSRSPTSPLAEIGDVVYGEAELLDAIRRLPELRLKLPSVLSLDAAPPDPDALARSTIDIEATRELARVLRRHARLAPAPSRCSRAHHFLVLTGPPEMGKTAIARMLGLALLTEGWEVHEVHAARADRGALRPRAPAAVHRRRRVRLDRVPSRRRRALGGRARPDPARERREPLAGLDLASRAAARGPAPAAPRARRRALPEPGRGAGRRVRARRRGEDADPLSATRAPRASRASSAS